jgi:hypothetical protein
MKRRLSSMAATPGLIFTTGYAARAPGNSPREIEEPELEPELV